MLLMMMIQCVSNLNDFVLGGGGGPPREGGVAAGRRRAPALRAQALVVHVVQQVLLRHQVLCFFTHNNVLYWKITLFY